MFVKNTAYIYPQQTFICTRTSALSKTINTDENTQTIQLVTVELADISVTKISERSATIEIAFEIYEKFYAIWDDISDAIHVFRYCIS